MVQSTCQQKDDNPNFMNIHINELDQQYQGFVVFHSAMQQITAAIATVSHSLSTGSLARNSQRKSNY